MSDNDLGREGYYALNEDDPWWLVLLMFIGGISLFGAILWGVLSVVS